MFWLLLFGFTLLSQKMRNFYFYVLISLFFIVNSTLIAAYIIGQEGFFWDEKGAKIGLWTILVGGAGYYVWFGVITPGPWQPLCLIYLLLLYGWAGFFFYHKVYTPKE